MPRIPQKGHGPLGFGGTRLPPLILRRRPRFSPPPPLFVSCPRGFPPREFRKPFPGPRRRRRPPPGTQGGAAIALASPPTRPPPTPRAGPFPHPARSRHRRDPHGPGFPRRSPGLPRPTIAAPSPRPHRVALFAPGPPGPGPLPPSRFAPWARGGPGSPQPPHVFARPPAVRPPFSLFVRSPGVPLPWLPPAVSRCFPAAPPPRRVVVRIFPRAPPPPFWGRRTAGLSPRTGTGPESPGRPRVVTEQVPGVPHGVFHAAPRVVSVEPASAPATPAPFPNSARL